MKDLPPITKRAVKEASGTPLAAWAHMRNRMAELERVAEELAYCTRFSRAVDAEKALARFRKLQKGEE